MSSIVNDFYEIRVDASRNRAFLILKGFWRKKEDVPNYISDFMELCAPLERGFTIVTDLRQFKPPSQEVAPLHAEVQRRLMDMGLARVAEVVSASLVKLAADKYSKDSGMSKIVVGSIEEAEAALDKMS
ncbi:MAG: hypothetical protein AAGA85_01440 [Bacteroidota bacterium]